MRSYEYYFPDYVFPSHFPKGQARKIQSMKTQDSIKKAADLLIKARLENKLISLPDELRPISIEEGYQIQDAIIEEIGV
ncbi:MAG TPA: hypothetical protein DDX98_08025, partial [Bacteroidales bacterium]|nr:hypothetical protein [Bacteroidales bacterium]